MIRWNAITARDRGPVRGAALLAAAMLLQPTAGAQETAWIDPGNYDHAGHAAKAPKETDLPPGLPPGYQVAPAHPAALKLQPTGMAFLPDGRLALAHWGGFGKQGSLRILSGVDGDPEKVAVTEIASGLWEPMGLQAVGGALYFTAQDGLYKAARSAAPGPERWEITRHAAFIIPIKQVGGDFPIAFNTAFDGKDFFFSTGAYKNFNAPPMNQGAVVRIPLGAGQQEVLARGIRMPNGLAANAVGDLFFADNQGEYRPYSGVFHVVKGRHYGMAAPDGKEGNMGGAMTRFLPLPPRDSIFPPAVAIPYRPGSASLTNLFPLADGPFAGQFLAGDNAWGGVHRVSVEMVKGEYQGACYQFSTVIEGGIQSFAAGPDGSIYGGTLGHPANGWSWLGRETGLTRWKPDGKPLASIATVSSQREGFDLRFTEPMAPAVDPDWYWVSSYRYEPTSAYGGPKLEVRPERITALRLSADRRTLAMSIAGLAAGRVYRIMIAPEAKTAAGASLFTRNAWYTLNRIGDAAPLGTALQDPAAARAGRGAAFRARDGIWRLRLEAGGPWSLEVLDARGTRIGSASGVAAAGGEIAVPGRGPRLARVTTAAGTYSRLLGPEP